MPIVDGMGFSLSSVSKARKSLKKGIRKNARGTANIGARGGAAFFTGGASETYRMKSRAITAGPEAFMQNEAKQRSGRYLENQTDGVVGLQDIVEGMGKRGGFRRIASRATGAVKKVASKSTTLAKGATKLASVKNMLKVSTGGLVDTDTLKEVGGGITDFAKGFIGKKGGGGESPETAAVDKVMASSQGGVFSWGNGGGGGGGGSTFTEEVEEMVTQMKPAIKYGMIGVGALAAIALFLKFKKGK